LAFERDKIKGAVRTDFILSAEIIAIALGTVANAVFAIKVAVLVAIAAAMTVGVYGLVAGIVKLDDLALLLSRQAGAGVAARCQRRAGAIILATAPYLMKSLSVAGTAAMFLVGGGIVAHGIAPLHHAIEHVAKIAAEGPAGAILGAILPALLNGAFGLLVGAIVLGAVLLVRRIVAKRGASAL
jgi:predicted DNA repair protein MutK